jgi:hypothetical protein
MTAKELIKKLQSKIDEHGDIEIFIDIDPTDERYYEIEDKIYFDARVIDSQDKTGAIIINVDRSEV